MMNERQRIGCDSEEHTHTSQDSLKSNGNTEDIISEKRKIGFKKESLVKKAKTMRDQKVLKKKEKDYKFEIQQKFLNDDDE